MSAASPPVLSGENLAKSFGRPQELYTLDPST
jgi:hypothetical protein